MFAIVTDSTAYFTRQEALDLGITIVPMNFIVNGNKFDEHFSDENLDFLQFIKDNANNSTTSQPSTLTFENIFNQLTKRGFDVICLTISSRLSGAFNTASLAAQNINCDKIKVVDSLSVMGGLKLLCCECAKMRDDSYTLMQAVGEIIRLRSHVGVVFSVEKMDALRRSGRVSAIKHSVGNMLNIRPLLEVKKGQVVSNGTARGVQNLINFLSSQVPSNPEKIILMSFPNTKSNKLMTPLALKHFVHEGKIEYQNAGPVLAIHLGLEAFGIAWLKLK